MKYGGRHKQEHQTFQGVADTFNNTFKFETLQFVFKSNTIDYCGFETN